MEYLLSQSKEFLSLLVYHELDHKAGINTERRDDRKFHFISTLSKMTYVYLVFLVILTFAAGTINSSVSEI